MATGKLGPKPLVHLLSLMQPAVHLIHVASFNTAMIQSKLDFNVHLMERFDGTNNSGIVF